MPGVGWGKDGGPLAAAKASAAGRRERERLRAETALVSNLSGRGRGWACVCRGGGLLLLNFHFTANNFAAFNK